MLGSDLVWNVLDEDDFEDAPEENAEEEGSQASQAGKSKHKGGSGGKKGWGVIHIKAKLHAKQAFFRLS